MSDFINSFLSDKSKNKDSVQQNLTQSVITNAIINNPILNYKTTKSGFQYAIKETILKVENVSLSYDKLILRDINFQIENIVRPGVKQGQVISLLGRSGIGKTQLFKIMAGLNKPTTGKVFIGSDLHEVKPGDFGVIPQNYLLFNHRTIRKNLEISAKNNELLQKSEIPNQIAIYAEKFGLSDKLDKYPMELSGGQRQRISIIQQILNGGDFFLFDEPFSGLDIFMIKKVLELLIQVSTDNELRTLVIVSHDVETACSISDDVIILGTEDGKEGATVKKHINLIDRGFVWKSPEEVRKDRDFVETIEEIKTLI